MLLADMIKSSVLQMEEDRLGMSITGDVTEIIKDTNGVIGISIGGGAPYCPCIYVVQVFEDSPMALNGRIQAGDEIVSVNGISVKGENKTEIAKMIQETEGSVKLGFNILHAELIDGYTLDIALKKMKHRVVESITTETADALGLSRAIICSDLLLQKLNRLEQCSQLYKELIKHLSALLNSHYHIAKTQKEFGDLFCQIAARESSTTTNKALLTFGNMHRTIEKHTVKLVKSLHPIVRDLKTFVEKAIPDTKLTLKKYLDAKFEYLAFCLKLKEMDDEEVEAASYDEPLYRVETGNYEYRLMLRCRQNSHEKFMKLRRDVMEKLELLDQKHVMLDTFIVQDIGIQLSSFVKAIMETHAECRDAISGANGLFPIDIDLEQIVHRYNTSGRLEEEEEENDKMEIVEEQKPEDLLDLS
uniref:PRKCA-binding protein n=1 Tax=Wuchereria bancrofti TaxID=6293 RepID=A0A1I8EQC6_WUCBA